MTGEAGEALLFARETAHEAAEIVRQGWGQISEVAFKRSPTDLLTEYDRSSEACIVDAITREFPHDSILAEESGSRGTRNARRRWLIDPIDGTTNFVHGLPLFAISIGLEIEGEPSAGVVLAPVLGWEFAACTGAGATWNGSSIHVSKTPSLVRSLLVTGFPYDRATSAENNLDNWGAFQKRTQGVRRLGAAALDLCFVALGWLDGYWEHRLSPWDLAAGSVIAREAGATLTDWKGAPFAADSGEIVCSNGLIHAEILAVLKEIAEQRAAGQGT